MMMMLISIIIATIVAGLLIKKNINKAEDSPLSKRPGAFQLFGSGMIAFIVIVFIGAIQPVSFKLVEAGNVGVKVSLLGADRGVGKYEYISGLVFYNSYITRVQEISLTQQHVEYDKMQAVTYGGLPVDISPKFNYSVKPGNAGDMYVNLRKPLDQIEKQWLSTSVLAAVNDVTNRWRIDSILTHRETYEADILQDANKKVGKWFTLSQLRTNLTPPPSLVKSIEEKTKAAQDIQVAEAGKLVAIAQGFTRKETAKADSAVKVIAAASEARANNLRQSSLTPMLIQQQLIEAWRANGSKVPQVITGSNTNAMYNMGEFLKNK